MKDKKIVAIIQAHMSSTRLPQKVMMDLAGKPALYRMIERLRHCKLLDDIVIATSVEPCDDILIEKCNEWGVSTFRGSDSDVLSRYWGAAQAYPADVYVRITSDNPLIDPGHMDDQIRFFLDHDYRYVACDEETTPNGIGGEVFTAELMRECAENSVEGYEHEHVTPYMYTKQDSKYYYQFQQNSAYRITLDTPEDYTVIGKLYDVLYKEGEPFTIHEVLEYLRAHPELVAVNAEIHQKGFMEGYE